MLEASEETTITTRSDPVPRRTGQNAGELRRIIEDTLDEAKAEDVVCISLAGKTEIADYMIVATALSKRQVGAVAERVRERLKVAGAPAPSVEGLLSCDWVLIDAGDVIVHVFRPEVREFYNLEKMWAVELPSEAEHTDPDGAN